VQYPLKPVVRAWEHDQIATERSGAVGHSLDRLAVQDLELGGDVDQPPGAIEVLAGLIAEDLVPRARSVGAVTAWVLELNDRGDREARVVVPSKGGRRRDSAVGLVTPVDHGEHMVVHNNWRIRPIY
jgi:hypothetical protein